MAMFVHLAAEASVARIRRGGIRRLRRAAGDFPGGALAVPVTRNFFVSHPCSANSSGAGLVHAERVWSRDPGNLDRALAVPAATYALERERPSENVVPVRRAG